MNKFLRKNLTTSSYSHYRCFNAFWQRDDSIDFWCSNQHIIDERRQRSLLENVFLLEKRNMSTATHTIRTIKKPLPIIQHADTCNKSDDDTMVLSLPLDSSAMDTVRIIEQKLKECSANEVAQFYFDNDYSNDTLLVILKMLHDNPQSAEGFLKAIQELVNEERKSAEKTTTIDHYRQVMYAWHDYNPTSAKRTQLLLDYMEKHAGIKYETQTCNLVLKTWAKKENAERAQAFFDQIIRNRVVPLDLDSYSYLLLAWSTSKSPLAPKQADRILLRMERFTNYEPNSECILRVIECWSKSRRKGAETRIESLFVTMKKQLTKSMIDNDRMSVSDDRNNNDGDVQNLQLALLNVLQAYQKIRNAHRAETILLDFVDDYKNEISHRPFPPTAEMFLSVLMAWKQSSSKNRATRAEKLLRMMEDNDEEFPDPNVACYTAVLTCIASSKKQDAAKRAETLLRRMYNNDNNKGTKPNMLSLTCVLIAWARSNDLDAHLHAERIFREIQDLGMKPDRYVYSGLITAWGRSNDKDSISTVENYFQRIKSFEEREALQNENSKTSASYNATVVEYTAVIQAYANYVSENVDQSRESVKRVKSLLDEMIESKNELLKPNTLTYAAVLKCIAAARRLPNRGDEADKILQKMYVQRADITPYIINLVKRCSGVRKEQRNGGTRINE